MDDKAERRRTQWLIKTNQRMQDHFGEMAMHLSQVEAERDLLAEENEELRKQLEEKA